MKHKSHNRTQKLDTRPHRIFISYNFSDRVALEYRQHLDADIEQLVKSKIWLSTEMQPGRNRKQAISDALENWRTVIKANRDTILEDTLSKTTPHRNLPDEIRKATDLQFTEHARLVVSENVESVESLNVDLIRHLRNNQDDIQKLRWDVFEHLVAEFLASRGFQDVALVGRDPMTSADIYAVHVVDSIGERLRFFVEVKRTRDKIGVDVIDQVLGAFVHERPRLGWDVAMIVSLAGFRELKKTSYADLSFMGVKLKDKDDVAKWLEGYEPGPQGLWLPKPDRHLPITTQRHRGQQGDAHGRGLQIDEDDP